MYGFINNDRVIFSGNKTKKKFIKKQIVEYKKYKEMFDKNISFENFLNLNGRKVIEYAIREVDIRELL
jgi:hypothetical protein